MFKRKSFYFLSVLSIIGPCLCTVLSAAEIYIGDSASERANISSGSNTYSILDLTIAMHTGSPVIYTPTSAEELIISEVNFYSAYSDSSTNGQLTPFVAVYDGINSTQGSGYTILAIGDAISVNATPELKNETFTVNGTHPKISVNAGQQIIAGFFQMGRIVEMSQAGSGVPDYIYSGDSISSQAIGQNLSGNSEFNNFDRKLHFNIGLDVVGQDNEPLNIGDIWFVGDSITQSNADGSNSSSPRRSLFNLFNANDVEFTYTGHSILNVDGLPTSGSTAATNLYHYHSGISGSVIGNDLSSRVGMTANLEAGINFWNTGRLATVKPEIILIKLGTNDVQQVNDLGNAPARISTLVDEIMGLPGVGSPTIFISTIAPNRRDGRPVTVAAFNAALPDVVAEQRLAGRDIFLVDNFTPLNDDYNNLMRNDDLHPNAAGNDVMAQQWYDAIMKRFSTKSGLSFEEWQIQNFGSTLASNAGKESNPDGDVLSNFEEFVFGGDPNEDDKHARVAPTFDGLKLQLTRREPVSGGITYSLQESSGLLGTWTDVTEASVQILSVDGDFENAEYTRPNGFIQETSNFYRIRAIATP